MRHRAATKTNSYVPYTVVLSGHPLNAGEFIYMGLRSLQHSYFVHCGKLCNSDSSDKVSVLAHFTSGPNLKKLCQP